MNKYVNSIEKNVILTSVIIMIMGLLLILNPIDTANGFVIILGLLLLFDGAFDMVRYLKTDAQYRIFDLGLYDGILKILVGLLLVFESSIFVSISSVVLGIILLFNSIFRIQLSINLKVMGVDSGLMILTSLLTMILGILLVSNPLEYFQSLIIIIGILLIVSQIITIIYSIYISKTFKDFDKKIISIFK